MGQQKVLGGNAAIWPQSPTCRLSAHLKSSSPSIHRVQREWKSPLVRFIGFLISVSFPVVLVKKLKSIRFFPFLSFLF